jgi:hypothetical protein
VGHTCWWGRILYEQVADQAAELFLCPTVADD